MAIVEAPTKLNDEEVPLSVANCVGIVKAPTKLNDEEVPLFVASSVGLSSSKL